jgi:hypothetical protein
MPLRLVNGETKPTSSNPPGRLTAKGAKDAKNKPPEFLRLQFRDILRFLWLKMLISDFPLPTPSADTSPRFLTKRKSFA